MACSSTKCAGGGDRAAASIWTTSSANASTSAASWVISSIGSAEPRLQLAQLGAQPLAQRRVERGERLVEQQRARLAGERARERGALALAAGELVGVAVGERAQLERVEPALDRVAARRRGADCASPASRPKAMFWRTVRCGNSAYSWNR